MSEFLQAIKAWTDELALFGAPLDTEDLIETILVGLNDDYNELVCAVLARDTFITLDKLHEKLLTFEASVLLTKPQIGNPPITMLIDPPHPLVVDQHLLLAIDFPVHI